MNIIDPILFQCARQPPAAAICVPGPGIGLISYRRLELAIHNISRRLLALGLRPGSIVAIAIDDVILHAAVLLASTRLAIITVSLRQSNASLPFQVAALLTSNASPFANASRVVPVDLSWIEGEDRPLEPHHLPRIEENDVCRILLTSGTTGYPKAVALTHKMLADRISYNNIVYNRLATCSRIYSDLPISSITGFRFLFHALWYGGTIFYPGDNFSDTLRAIEEYKVQCLLGSPGGFEILLRWYDTVPAYQSNIELMVSVGGVLSQSLSGRLRSRICSHLIAAYGATETGTSAVAHAHEITHTPRAVGFVAPGVAIQVVNESGTILPSGEEGFIRVRSKYAVDGYIGNPEESAKVFRDGWFYPGDIGTLSPGGLLVISGREQTVINLGGDKINPEIIEQALSQFNGIVEAGAFCAANEYGNNEVYALVVSQGKLDAQKLRAHCETRLSRTFVPLQFLPVATLPRNETGKIDRPRLQELGNKALALRQPARQSGRASS
jgi:acyl-coenzyme A synthetase/AMP-(fatty) acid ligase